MPSRLVWSRLLQARVLPGVLPARPPAPVLRAHILFQRDHPALVLETVRWTHCCSTVMRLHLLWKHEGGSCDVVQRRFRCVPSSSAPPLPLPPPLECRPVWFFAPCRYLPCNFTEWCNATNDFDCQQVQRKYFPAPTNLDRTVTGFQAYGDPGPIACFRFELADFYLTNYRWVCPGCVPALP